MKKHLFLVLRVLFAVLGIGYIAWMVDWTDQVVVPAGTSLSDGRVVEESASFPVVSGVYNPTEPSGEIMIQIGRHAGEPVTMAVPEAALGVDVDGLRFAPGIVTMLRHARMDMLLLGLLLVSVIYPIQMLRWSMLMRCRGIRVPLSKAFALTMVGSFFNYCMPGTTGGDLVKAYYAAKGSDRRADAVMSVVFDRIAGLLALVVLAGAVGLFMLDDPLARVATVYIGLGVLAGVVMAMVYFSTRLRRRLGVDWLLNRLPAKGLLGSIDQAAVAYREHYRIVISAVVISIPVHLALATATALAGYALGMRTPMGLLLVVVPICFLLGSLPLAPQGIGVMEVFAMTMLLNPPVAFANQIVGMLLMIRLYQVFYSLMGSVYLLKGDIHLHPQGIDQPQQVPTDPRQDGGAGVSEDGPAAVPASTGRSSATTPAGGLADPGEEGVPPSPGGPQVSPTGSAPEPAWASR